MLSETTVATVFVNDTDGRTLTEKLVSQCEILIDHYTSMIDIRHCTEGDQKAKRVRVSVSLEDA